MGIKVLSIGIAVVACGLLYFGTGMLLLVPGFPGESYFTSGRMIYGAVPTMSSAALLVLAGWLWSRAVGDTEWSKFVGKAFSWAIAAVVVFWIGLIIISQFQHN